MKTHRYVVFADRMRGFDSVDEARSFAIANPPAVICERRKRPDGRSILEELQRYDWLYDEERAEWRYMLG